MKKIYITSILLVSVFTVSAQLKSTVGQITSKFSPNVVHKTKAPVVNEEKVSYLSEDFETWPLTGWTISSGPASTITVPADQAWHQVAGGNPGSAAGILYNNSTDVHDEYLISPEITLPAAGNYRINFDFSTSVYWHAGTFDNVDITVQISLDNGATWGDTLWQEDIQSLLDASYSSGWETYVWKRAYCNISAYAGNNVKFRFKYFGQDGAQCFVDNILVEDIPDNNLTILGSYNGDIINDWDYSKVPVAQVKPQVIGVAVQNQGVNDQIGKDIHGAINLLGSDVFTQDINTDILVGEIDTFWYTTGYTPSTIGIYDVNFSLPVDDVLTDNMSSVFYETTDYIYAHDFTADDVYGFDNDAELSIGNAFTMENDADLSAIQVEFGTGTDVGIEISGILYSVGTSIQDLTFMSEVYYVVQSSDIDAVTNLIFASPVTLTAGETYVIEIRKTSAERFYVNGSAQGDADNSTISYGPWGTSSAVNWFNGWGWSPAVRMNFDPSLGIEEVNSLEGVSVYPNPSEGLVTISNDLNVENTITVTDLTGKVVATKVAATSTTIDLSNVRTGVYLVKVENTNGKKVERVVIK